MCSVGYYRRFLYYWKSLFKVGENLTKGENENKEGPTLLCPEKEIEYESHQGIMGVNGNVNRVRIKSK